MRNLLLAAALLATPLAAQAQNRASAAPTQAIVERGSSVAPRRIAATVRDQICRGAAVPMGWILVDNQRDAATCEGQNPAALSLYNVWVISRYDTLPVGSMLDVCAAAQTPEGWQMVDLYRSKDTCGHPNDPFTANVKRIKRVK